MLNIFHICESIENQRNILTNKELIFAIVVIIRKNHERFNGKRKDNIVFGSGPESTRKKNTLGRSLFFVKRSSSRQHRESFSKSDKCFNLEKFRKGSKFPPEVYNVANVMD